MTSTFVFINDSHFHDAVLNFSLQNYNEYSNLVFISSLERDTLYNVLIKQAVFNIFSDSFSSISDF